MKRFHVRSQNEYFKELSEKKIRPHYDALDKLIPTSEENFLIEGFSLAADRIVNFQVDFIYGKYPIPNWRERVTCPITKLNNRMRFADFIIETYAGILSSDETFIMEQTTPFYHHLKAKYENLTGSEFLGPEFKSGYINSENVLHQDATKLSFKDDIFKVVLSFDVIEHIPDYEAALRESFRVLCKGGKFIFTAPFINSSNETLIRARVEKTGKIVHLMEPEYHGDPLNVQGVLCYQHFGWDIIDSLLTAGFDTAYAIVGFSLSLGFMTPQIIFIAEKH